MKTYLYALLTMTTVMIPIHPSQADEFVKVRGLCHQMACESGLYCIKTRDNEEKCSSCSQSDSDWYSRSVDDSCKALGEGWTPETSDEYQNELAPDGRVMVDVYDKMLEKAKTCKAARVTREDKCWGGGDDEHKRQITDVDSSIRRMSDHKITMINQRRVYYTSGSTYRYRLNTFGSKCNLNFPDMNQKLDITKNAQEKGEKVNCSDIERYGNDSESCFDAAKTLYNEGFSGSSYKLPSDYEQMYKTAEDTSRKAKELLSTVKTKNLCN